MKIVYSIESIESSGGIERVLSTKTNYFADVLGYEVHIIVLHNTAKPFFSFSSKIQIHALGIEKITHKPWMIFGSRSRKEYQKKLFQKLEEIKPDITVSVFGLDAEFLYKAQDGSVKVLEFHFTKNYLTHLVKGLPDVKLRWLRKLWVQFIQYKERFYSGKYEHIVLLTEKDKQLWCGGDKFTVIPNPLSFVSEKQALLENKKILAMGRFIAQKGFDLLIQAFALLQKKYPDWRLFIYGRGDDAGYFNVLIDNMALRDNVFLKNPVKDVEKIMLDSSLFVFPSRYEGFGLVLTEAMTCGIPCVAFDCECGPSDIIKDSVDGFLVETGNVQQLSEKMESLIHDRKLRVKMGRNARKNVERFSVPVIMNLWKDYFSQLIDN